MSKSNRKLGVAGKAAALAAFALAAAACTDDARDESPASTADTAAGDTYDSTAAGTDANDTYADTSDTYGDESVASNDMGSATDRSQTAAGASADAQQIATTLGVSELDDLENWKITNNGEELGEIDRIGVDRETGEVLAVVGLEGVVGVNMKEVGIPLNRLQKGGEDETLSTNLTKDELQQKRDIDPWDGSDPLDGEDEGTM